MYDSMSASVLLRRLVHKGQKTVYSDLQRQADKARISAEMASTPKNSRVYMKAKLLQVTRDMRSIKLNVRRLTQTELVPGEVKEGRLNESFTSSMNSG